MRAALISMAGQPRDGTGAAPLALAGAPGEPAVVRKLAALCDRFAVPHAE